MTAGKTTRSPYPDSEGEREEGRTIDSDSERRYYKALIRQAKTGDRASALELLREFAQSSESLPPSLASYVAECMRAWLASECDPQKAVAAFNMRRNANRSGEDPRITAKHVRALQVYFVLRGRRKGYNDSIRRAAKSVHLSASSVKKLVEEEKHEDKREAALLAIGMKSRAVSRRSRKAVGLPLLEDLAPRSNPRRSKGRVK